MLLTQLSFNTTTPYFIAIAGILLVSFIAVGYLLYQGFGRTQRLRFYLLICLNGIATIALLGLISQPYWQTDEPQFATLITAGNGLPTTEPTAPVYVFNDNSEHKSKPPWPLIYGTEQLSKRIPNLQKLHIVGHGLYSQQLQHIADINIEFTADSIAPGLVTVSWNKQLTLGQRLTFNARFITAKAVSTAATNKSSVLTARIFDIAGNAVTETNILQDEPFQLSWQPKAIGHYLYRLEILDSNQQVLTQQSIGVNVAKGVATNIMLIQSAPSFESKQLANWVSQHQAKVIIHTQISKDKYLSQRFNIGANEDISLSPELLTKQDLVIVNGASLLAMNSTQQQWLASAVDNGLGLLVLADTQLIEHFKGEPLDLLRAFTLTESAESNSRTYPVWSQSTTLNKMSDVALTRLAAILGVTQGKVLIADKEPLNVATEAGLGVIAMSTLRERHRWYTQGEISTYSHYWQFIMAQISRTNNDVRFSNGALTGPIMATHKQQVCTIGKLDITAKITHLSSQKTQQIRLNDSLLIENQRCGVYWPQISGWYQLTLNSPSTTQALTNQYVHVAASKDWLSWQQHKKVSATLQAAQNSNANIERNSPLGAQIPIKPSIFWWLFIISASLLWIEQKTRSTING